MRGLGPRARGAHAWVLLALSGPAPWGAQVARARVGARSLDGERCFDALKYRTLPDHLALDVAIPSVGEPSLAPSGGAVLQVGLHGVPYKLDGGWTDAARDALATSVQARLEQVAPGLGALVVGRAVVSPADVEARTGARGGHVFHGEHALDQLWAVRPTLRLSRHETGVAGLYLASPGAHPGGFLTGGSGWLAAKAALAAG